MKVIVHEYEVTPREFENVKNIDVLGPFLVILHNDGSMTGLNTSTIMEIEVNPDSLESVPGAQP